MCTEMPARKPVVTGIEQIRDPAQPERSGGDQQKPDHQRQRRGQRRIFRRAGRGQNGEPAGKDRRYRRIRAA
jgi:hypothetical protein